MNRYAVYEGVSGRTFLTYARDETAAKALVKLFLAREDANAQVKQKRVVLTAALAGSWEQVGVASTGDVQKDLVGDATSVVTLWDERKAPGA